LGICYGAQLTADFYGGEVGQSEKREYGKIMLQHHAPNDPFFAGIQALAGMDEPLRYHRPHARRALKYWAIPIPFLTRHSVRRRRAFCQPVYGIQFHPEVFHSLEGFEILKNFVHDICGCAGDWTPSILWTGTIAEDAPTNWQ
jgi:GMP synthase (glutamine-hydrolysing)